MTFKTLLGGLVIFVRDKAENTKLPFIKEKGTGVLLTYNEGGLGTARIGKSQ
jgi:hypothetical protein